MRRRLSLSATSGLSVFLLLALLMVLALLTVVLGAGVYRSVVARSEESHNLRTAISYVAGKVRAADQQGCVRVEKMEDGNSALVLLEEAGSKTYETRIYFHDGALYEAYMACDAEFVPQDGQKLSEIEDFRILLESENLLSLEALERGEKYTMHLALRSGWEGM